MPLSFRACLAAAIVALLPLPAMAAKSQAELLKADQQLVVTTATSMPALLSEFDTLSKEGKFKGFAIGMTSQMSGGKSSIHSGFINDQRIVLKH